MPARPVAQCLTIRLEIAGHDYSPRHELIQVQQHPRDRHPFGGTAAAVRVLGSPAFCAFLDQDAFHRLELLVRRRTRQAEQKGMPDPLAIGRRLGSILEDPGREPASDLDKRRVVEQGQRLERGVGSQPTRAGLHAARRVEGRQERVRSGPPEEGIEPAPVTVRAGIGPPGAFHLAEVHDALGLGREDARAAEDSRQEPAAGQGRVADQLGVQPEPRLSPEQPVVGIDRLSLGANPRCLAVCRRAHDQTMDGLETPVAIHQLAGQPVEQLGMAGGRALGPEVVVGLDQARARNTPARSD